MANNTDIAIKTTGITTAFLIFAKPISRPTTTPKEPPPTKILPGAIFPFEEHRVFCPQG